MMKAQILVSPASIDQHPLQLSERPVPEPGPGQIRLRISACGVCHTDLHEVEGDIELPRLPITPGHQVVGIVDKVGSGVTSFSPGERAGTVWLYRTCGKCKYCRSGRENLCENAEFTGPVITPTVAMQNIWWSMLILPTTCRSLCATPR